MKREKRVRIAFPLRLVFVAASLFLLSCSSSSPSPLLFASATPSTLACSLRQLALEYAVSLQQSLRPPTVFQEIADALNGAPEAEGCVVTLPEHLRASPSRHSHPHENHHDLRASSWTWSNSQLLSRVRSPPVPRLTHENETIFFVDIHHGVDAAFDPLHSQLHHTRSSASSAAVGTVTRPFRTLEHTVLYIRQFRLYRFLSVPVRSLHAAFSASAARVASDGTAREALTTKLAQHAFSLPVVYVVLRAGVYSLPTTLTLTPADSCLRFQSHPDELVRISGSLILPSEPSSLWKQITPIARKSYEVLTRGSLGQGFDVVEPAVMTLQEAQEYCSQLPLCSGLSTDAAAYTSGQPSLVYFKYINFYAPSNNNVTLVKNVGYVDITTTPSFYVINATASIGLQLDGRPIDSLRVNGARYIRARYPNVRNAETLGAMQMLAKSWTTQSDLPSVASYTFNPPTPSRTDELDGWFQTFRLGIGGSCARRFTPQASYWCANNSQGGGPGPYLAPVGMLALLPHLPYTSSPSRASVFTWRQDRWFSWAFLVDSISYPKSEEDDGDDNDNNDVVANFSFSQEVGGNQGSRGGNDGQEFFIDNVLDELDAPGEFYFDDRTGLLYIWFNGTDVPSNSIVEAVVTQTLFRLEGTQERPVHDVKFSGLVFENSAASWFEPHGTPSGGDWALARSGTLFLTGSTDASITGCVFRLLDNHALFQSGYARRTQIVANEFVNLGESAVVSWGLTDGTPNVPGMGYDGTAGNQPRFTNVSFNLFHELGIFLKQNSAIFQSESFGNVYDANIGYNGPRAGINFNDGMGGGSCITRNLLFNFCRESSDHGPFNSWNRQVYLVEDGQGGKTWKKQNDTIAHNLMLSNYHSSMAIDNDDGSAYYDTHHNVFVNAAGTVTFGGFSLKSDFGGHSNYHHDNLDVFYSAGFSLENTLPGYQHGFYNNYLYMSIDGEYGHQQTCNGEAATLVHSNTIWSPTGTITECSKSLQEWQTEGGDPDTTASQYPDDSVVLKIARSLLDL